MQPYRDCTTCLRELPRPDAKLKEMVSRTLLWQVKAGVPVGRAAVAMRASRVGHRGETMVRQEEEMHIKAGFDQVERIVESNLENMAKAGPGEAYVAGSLTDRDTVADLRETCPNVLRMQMMRIDATEVNHKLEQCAEDCIAKLLKSLAVRNQDRSSRPSAAGRGARPGSCDGLKDGEQLVELENAVEEAKAKVLPSLLEEYDVPQLQPKGLGEFNVTRAGDGLGGLDFDRKDGGFHKAAPRLTLIFQNGLTLISGVPL
eukprot:Skav218531  [mRNA]  locus=scaffold2478:334412:339538:- [translate_table: standard]